MSIEDNIKDLTAAVGELNEGLGALTTTVSELCAYMAKLVDSTADAVDVGAPGHPELDKPPVRRTRKAKPAAAAPAANDGGQETPAPATPAEPVAEAPAAAPEAPATPEPATPEAAAPESKPEPAKDPAALRADLRGAAMRLAAHVGRDPAIAKITEHLESRGIHVANISKLSDDQVPETLAFLEDAIATALKEAA